MTRVKELASAILDGNNDITFSGPHAGNALAGYVQSGTYAYANETLAKDACKARNDCNGVTKETEYTLRAGSTLTGSSNGEVSWKKVGSIRKVRVQPVSMQQSLKMKEVEVFDQNGTNVALKKVATQSSTYEVFGSTAGNGPLKAVNGNVTDSGQRSGSEAGKYFNYQLQQPVLYIDSFNTY